MAAPADKTASDELAEYKAERARNWPSRVNVERKSAQLSDMQSRGELDLQADAHKRKLRLQSILEQQRKLGHFEASRECAALVSGGDPHASEARKKQRKQDAPREKEQHIAGGAKHLAGSSADDESRRLREREAALARMRGGAEAPKVVAVEGAEPAKDAAPAAHARGPAAAASHKHARGEQPAPPQVAAHAAQKKAAPSLLSKLLASEIRRERSHLLQAFRFLSQNGLLAEGAS